MAKGTQYSKQFKEDVIRYLSALEAGYLLHWKPSFLSSDLIPLLYQKGGFY